MVRIALVLSLGAVLLTACAPPDGEVSDNVTWQFAKKEAQATALEIAQLVPERQVASVEQNPQGVLLSCDADRHQWTGLVTVTLTEDARVPDVVAYLADHFRASDEYTLEEYSNGSKAKFQLTSPGREENYIVGPGINEGQLEVSAASVCFTLPEDVYPGGEF